MNNYHTHTFRCRHASGDVPDYVAAARLAGIGELGFPDHVPQPGGRWAWGRMLEAELGGYIGAVGRAREAEAAGGMSILLGLECEWAADLGPYYREELLGAFGIEYLAAGIHVYDMDDHWHDSFAIRDARGLRAYARQVEGAAASGLFSYLAHPDVFCSGWLPWDADAEACARDVLAACAAARLPIEINGNGLRKPMVHAPEGRRRPYPHPRFWELASEYEVAALVGSDAHSPHEVGAGLVEGKDLAESCGVAVSPRLGAPACSPPRKSAYPIH